MNALEIEQKVFEIFDELVADFDENAYIDICGCIGTSFMIRAEGDGDKE